MDIFEYAMQMEKDGEVYYRHLAEQTFNADLRSILIMLADEELKHFNIIKDIQKGKLEVVKTTVLDDAKNIFVLAKESGQVFDLDIGQIELCRRVQDIEVKSRNFYLEKSNEVEQEYQKEIFLKLAEEENKHYFLLENIIEFLSRPEQWLENAEFFDLEEY